MNENNETPKVQNSLATDSISADASGRTDKKAMQRKYRQISVLLIGIISVAIILLVGYFLRCTLFGHQWTAADCENPKTCKICEQEDGSALGHNWNSATCITAMTCSNCGATEGGALGHAWQDATCTLPMMCSVCNATNGSPLGHKWLEATRTSPAKCSSCGITSGTCIMPTLIFTNLCWGGDGSPQFDCKDNVATLSFPTWSDFSTSKITIENANNKTISQDNFGFEWRNGVVYITPNEALTVGVYDIHFSCKSGTTTYSLCYGYKGDIYLECEDVGWFDLQFQNWKNERYLVQTNNGLETTPAYADRTTFGSRRDMCGIEVGSDGFAYPTQNGLLVQFATQTYIHHGEKSLWAFTYDGWYMAADTKGTVYFTKNLTDECYWIVAP